MLYHGTTHKFNEFNANIGNVDNHVGSGIYLTDCKYDAITNYAGIGPDLKNRIYSLSDDYYSDSEYDDRLQRLSDAANILIGGPPTVLSCEISEDANMFVLGNQYIELYNCSEDEDVEPEFTDMGLAISEVLDENDLDNIIFDGECKSSELFNNLCNVCCRDGINAGELFKEIIIRAGYDGVEYEDAYIFFKHLVDPGVKHYVLYKSSLVSIIDREEIESPQEFNDSIYEEYGFYMLKLC